MSLRILLLTLFLCLPALGVAAPQAQDFTKLENCRLEANPGNDGDSFHVIHDGTEYIFRLYFVDTPESETDSLMESRIEDQAEYFGISEAQTIQLGKKAAKFSEQKLKDGFTVYTRFRDALGRSKLPRYYAVVMVGSEDLAQTLVRNGLARIYGTRTPLPDGTDSRKYLADLASLEAEAKVEHLGGWGGVNTPEESSPGVHESQSPTGTDFDSFFKKK